MQNSQPDFEAEIPSFCFFCLVIVVAVVFFVFSAPPPYFLSFCSFSMGSDCMFALQIAFVEIGNETNA